MDGTNLGLIPFASYLALDAVNASSLKDLAVSARNYRWRRDNPRLDTDALRLGRAVHTAVLEPDRFPQSYVPWTGGRRAGNDWKAFSVWNAFRTVLREEDYMFALRIRDAVSAHPAAASYLSMGLEAEHSITWTDRQTGLRCKARLDLSDEGIVDIKTTRNPHPRAFARDAAKYLYHLQFAFYGDGYAIVKGRRPKFFAVIAAQNREPFDVVVYRVSTEMLLQGRHEYRRLLNLLADCRQRNEWPGIAEAELALDLPSWAMAREMPQLTAGGKPLDLNL